MMPHPENLCCLIGDIRNLALNKSIAEFDQRRLRSTTVQVRTPDGRVSVTDRDGNLISKIANPRHLNDDLSRYGFIVNNDPDLQVGEVTAQGEVFCFGMYLMLCGCV